MPVSGQSGDAEIQLHPHKEDAAALERATQQTGSAIVYRIHFDTDSAKLRPDSMPALNAVLGLIKNHPGSRWSIAGHTDNQGSANRSGPEAQRGPRQLQRRVRSALALDRSPHARAPQLAADVPPPSRR